MPTWMVLEAYGIPTFVIRAIQMLYKDAYHHVTFRGGIFLGFTLTRGVRQGCPLSGLIFAFCLDPLMRMFEASFKGQGIIRALFDDIGMVIYSFRAMHKRIYDIFALFKQVSGLGNSHRKTVIIPRWNQGNPINQRCNQILLFLARGAAIRDRGTYLGFMMGVMAHVSPWKHILDNYTASFKQIRQLCLGLCSSIRLYNMLSFTKLTFIAQCYKAETEVLSCEQRAVQLLHPGPRNSPSTALLSSIKSLGAKLQVPLIAIQGRAIMFRAFCSTSRILDNHLVRLFLPLSDQDVLINDFVIRQWILNSFVFEVERNRKDVLERYDLSTQVISGVAFICNLLDLPQLQHKLTLKLEANCLPCDAWLVTKSVRRFQAVVPNQAIIIENCKLINANLPPFVCFDLIRLWSNGWITRQHFAEADSICALCKVQCHADDVNHLIHCVIDLSLRCVFSPQLQEMDLLSTLCLCRMPTSQLLLQAMFLSTLRHVHSLFRFQDNSWESLVHAVNARKRFIATKSSGEGTSLWY